MTTSTDEQMQAAARAALLATYGEWPSVALHDLARDLGLVIHGIDPEVFATDELGRELTDSERAELLAESSDYDSWMAKHAVDLDIEFVSASLANVGIES
jgi:hypothetical protein